MPGCFLGEEQSSLPGLQGVQEGLRVVDVMYVVVLYDLCLPEKTVSWTVSGFGRHQSPAY